MEKTAVIDSLGEHMDSLKVTIGWALLVAFVVGFGAFENHDKVQVLGLSLKRDLAFYMAAAFYSFVNFKVLFLLIKIRHLMHYLKNNDFVEGLSKVALHSFVANPFGYFLKGKITWINTAGPGLLIVAWWVANSSLYVISRDTGVRELVLILIFSFIGLLTLLAMNRFERFAMDFLKCFDPKFYAELVATRTRRSGLTYAGILVGGSIGILALFSETF